MTTIETRALTYTASLRRHLLETLAVAVVLTVVSYVVGFLLGWISEANWLEVAAVATSYACTYLVVKQRRINYPIGAVSTALYAILFYQYGLYASMALNAFLSLWLIYGWIRWRSDANGRPVTHLTGKMIPVYILIGVVGWGAGYTLVNALGGSLAIFDVIILVGTVIAQTLMDNKKLENWIVWAIVNVVAIYVYFSSGLALAGFQYVFFLANAVYGFVEWRNSMLRTRAIGRHPAGKKLVNA